MNENYIERMGRHYGAPENARRPEYLNKIAANAAAIPFEIETLGDLAYRAHYNTSHTPEIGQLLDEMDYTGHLAEFCGEILVARDDEAALQELKRYYEKFRALKIARLTAASRCISSFITGPSNFPVRRAEKANATERKRTEELLEWIPRAQHAVQRNLGQLPDSGIISSDDESAIEKIKEKIAKIQKDNEVGKAVNKLLRSTKLSPEEKAAQIAALKAGFEPLNTWFHEVGIPSYRLALNNAEVKRLQGRLIQLERLKADAAKQEANGGAPEEEFDGGRVVDNAAENRVQIFFDGKPDAKTRTELKSNGFRWASSIGAWQSYRNWQARDKAKHICGIPETTQPHPKEPTKDCHVQIGSLFDGI